MNRLSHLHLLSKLPANLGSLHSFLETFLNSIYYDILVVTPSKGGYQLEIGLLHSGQGLSWGIIQLSSGGHYFTISPSYSGRNQISIDRKSVPTWRYGSKVSDYQEYLPKITNFAKIYYLELSKRTFDFFPDNIWENYSKYVLDQFIQELVSYNK